jgi:hypothetical protein
VRISTLAGVVASAAAAAIAFAPITVADTATSGSTVQTQPFGSQGRLVDGPVIQGWTITDLKPSSDNIPYQPVGRLWEATATDEAIQGSVTPIVSNLNARAADGTNYRALFGVATPQGVNPATLAQGQKTTGKVYFDVTGPDPDRVVYNSAGTDLLVWVKPAPASSSSTPSSRDYTPAPTRSTPASTATEDEVEEVEVDVVEEEVDVEVIEEEEGAEATGTATEGSQGTPLPAGSSGTPIDEATEATPATQGTPAAEGSSSGTPIAEGTTTPAGSQDSSQSSTGGSSTPTTYLPTP